MQAHGQAPGRHELSTAVLMVPQCLKSANSAKPQKRRDITSMDPGGDIRNHTIPKTRRQKHSGPDRYTHLCTFTRQKCNFHKLTYHFGLRVWIAEIKPSKVLMGCEGRAIELASDEPAMKRGRETTTGGRVLRLQICSNAPPSGWSLEPESHKLAELGKSTAWSSLWHFWLPHIF